MKLRLAVFTAILLPSLASANLDEWEVLSAKVEPSVAIRADGSKIKIPGELAMALRLATKREFGTAERREIKQQSVELPANGLPGKISLSIQSSTEQRCNSDSGGISFMVTGVHSAYSSVVLQEGSYVLELDGVEFGQVQVSSSGAIVKENAAYAARLEAINDEKFERLFGAIVNYGIRSDELAVRIAKTPNGYSVAYAQAQTVEKLSNGDVLTRSEKQGTVSFERIYRMRESCEGSWDLELVPQDRSRGDSLEVSIEEEGADLRVIARLDGKSFILNRLK